MTTIDVFFTPVHNGDTEHLTMNNFSFTLCNKSTESFSGSGNEISKCYTCYTLFDQMRARSRRKFVFEGWACPIDGAANTHYHDAP